MAAGPIDPVLADLMAALRLVAHDPAGLGGILLRGGDLIRNDLVAALAGLLPPGAPVRRLPIGTDEDRLLGGIDLGETLASGRAVARRGLLAETDGGVLVVPMAERLGDMAAAHLANALDTGMVHAARDGMEVRADARLAVVAFDDGSDDDDLPPAKLADRLAFHIDLGGVRAMELPAVSALPADPAPIAAVEADILTALAATADMLGIDGARAPLFALRAARAAAALAGRTVIAEDDVALAARLVLGPRATRLPPSPEDAVPPDAEPPPPPPDNQDQAEGDTDQAPLPPDDIVLAAAMAALPKGLLDTLAKGGRRRGGTRGRGRGQRQRSATRGRPVGTRQGLPRGGLRLSLIDTLRAAAPWQRLRRGADGPDRLVHIRRDDLRIRRFESRAEAMTIFAVDASGSSALTRLAEAKGAVELLLAEAYVKRAQVALVAFRGEGAELLLPPTRSLVRAKRALADMAGGGGTPIAAGLATAHALAADAQRRGRTPFIVVLTDGRANIAADGIADRARAESDATAAARAIGRDGLKGALVDISPRPRPEGAALAAAMGARYLPLPRADARDMHRAVKAAQG